MATGGTPATTAAPDARFLTAHRHLLADHHVQFDLPKFVPPQLPDWLQPLFRLLAHGWPVIRIALWVAVAAAVLLLIRFAWRRWKRRRRGADETPEPGWRPQEAPARALLAEADALAAAGDYGAAAHLVLLRSVDQIATRRPGVLGPALTSRDIARLAALPGDVARAFAVIGKVVETGFFGARPVEAAAWERCRSAYAAVAFPAAWA